jgi:hypothetical protein
MGVIISKLSFCEKPVSGNGLQTFLKLYIQKAQETERIPSMASPENRQPRRWNVIQLYMLGFEKIQCYAAQRERFFALTNR